MTNNINSTFDLTKLNTIAHDQACRLRVARRALKLAGGPQGAYVDCVLGHRLNPGQTLSVLPNQHLQPLQMSRHLTLFRGQEGDDDTIRTLVAAASADVAHAEDAVVLLGKQAGPFLAKLHIDYDDSELKDQEGLFDIDQKEVKPGRILESVLDGLQTLRDTGQMGDYYAIVSPALYHEAYKNRQTLLDAPIYQIQALLSNNGFCCDAAEGKTGTLGAYEYRSSANRFLYSEAAEGRKGVIFSVARGTINLAVPMDTYVERLTDDNENMRPRFRVAQQMCLVVDDRNARAALK